MAIYCVTGKLGSGKTLACVGRIRDGIVAGKRIATNLDLNLASMIPRRVNPCTVDVTRIPDKPTSLDLVSLGCGNASSDESKNGLLVLDELGAWFNARSWADKSRQGVIDWLLHSRKHGWDVYLIIQHPKMLDSQAREGLVEFLVTCRRLDRLRIPFVSSLLKMFTGYNLTMPRLHIASVRYGMERDALLSDRWTYRGVELYKAYDTRQVFTDVRVEPFRLPWSPVPARSWREFFFPSPVRVVHLPKHPLIARIMKLPCPVQRMEFFRRFEAAGSFGTSPHGLSANI